MTQFFIIIVLQRDDYRLVAYMAQWRRVETMTFNLETQVSLLLEKVLSHPSNATLKDVTDH